MGQHDLALGMIIAYGHRVHRIMVPGRQRLPRRRSELCL
jgi:hypothetical protein